MADNKDIEHTSASAEKGDENALDAPSPTISGISGLSAMIAARTNAAPSSVEAETSAGANTTIQQQQQGGRPSVPRLFGGNDGHLLRIPPPDLIIPSLTIPTKDIDEPHRNDVLCGRGGGTNNHVGNEKFRDLVNSQKVLYLHSCKRDKPFVSRGIVRAVRAQNPPGRFLQKNERTGLWYDIGDQKAREKTSQALREGAPDIRREITSNLGVASHVLGSFPPPTERGTGVIYPPPLPPPLCMDNVGSASGRGQQGAMQNQFSQKEIDRHMRNARQAEAAIITRELQATTQVEINKENETSFSADRQSASTANTLAAEASSSEANGGEDANKRPPKNQSKLKNAASPNTFATTPANLMALRQQAMLETSGIPVIQFPPDIAKETASRFGGLAAAQSAAAAAATGFGSPVPNLAGPAANVFPGALSRNQIINLAQHANAAHQVAASANVLNAPPSTVLGPGLERDLAHITRDSKQKGHAMMPTMGNPKLANLMQMAPKLGPLPPPLTEDMARRLVLAETVSQKTANGTVTPDLIKAEEKAALYLEAGLLGIDPDELAGFLAKGHTEEEIVRDYCNAVIDNEQDEDSVGNNGMTGSTDQKRGASLIWGNSTNGKPKKVKLGQWPADGIPISRTTTGRRIHDAMVSIGALPNEVKT
mmetsp:Transcript_25249/g.35604  ORF Transcript_25249/g.35604 Transcript_25249/m.35604 type:complete len:652 (+) Transcript_25249:309-2264(+)